MVPNYNIHTKSGRKLVCFGNSEIAIWLKTLAVMQLAVVACHTHDSIQAPFTDQGMGFLRKNIYPLLIYKSLLIAHISLLLFILVISSEKLKVNFSYQMRRFELKVWEKANLLSLFQLVVGSPLN